jgi:hypothetical protein
MDTIVITPTEMRGLNKGNIKNRTENIRTINIDEGPKIYLGTCMK